MEESTDRQHTRTAPASRRVSNSNPSGKSAGTAQRSADPTPAWPRCFCLHCPATPKKQTNEGTHCGQHWVFFPCRGWLWKSLESPAVTLTFRFALGSDWLLSKKHVTFGETFFFSQCDLDIITQHPFAFHALLTTNEYAFLRLLYQIGGTCEPNPERVGIKCHQLRYWTNGELRKPDSGSWPRAWEPIGKRDFVSGFIFKCCSNWATTKLRRMKAKRWARKPGHFQTKLGIRTQRTQAKITTNLPLSDYCAQRTRATETTLSL